MSARHSRSHAHHLPRPAPSLGVAAAYDSVGDDYAAYADGDTQDLFSFTGPHSYADRRVWSAVAEQLQALRAEGRDAIRILDAGCGPGVWLRRAVVRARELGFSAIAARGFDVAETQVEAARRAADHLAGLPGLELAFEVGDLREALPEADGSVDLTLCLYSVLSHLPYARLPSVAQELARVTGGHLTATVRSIGSTPTIFVDSLDKARTFSLDHAADRCEIELVNGRRIALDAHLFSARELFCLFDPWFEVEELCGVDIFHSRFAPDIRWNPVRAHPDRRLERKLEDLEAAYERNPAFVDRGAHVLLTGRRLGHVPPRVIERGREADPTAASNG